VTCSSTCPDQGSQDLVHSFTSSVHRSVLNLSLKNLCSHYAGFELLFSSFLVRVLQKTKQIRCTYACVCECECVCVCVCVCVSVCERERERERERVIIRVGTHDDYES
jgi:hypothetical protein